MYIELFKFKLFALKYWMTLKAFKQYFFYNDLKASRILRSVKTRDKFITKLS